MPEPREENRPLSAVLRDVADYGKPRISVDHLMGLFGDRALGALILIFGLFCMLPLPPGGTTIFGAPLLLLAPQLFLGRDAPWLPAGLRRRSLATHDIRRGLLRTIPWLQRLEALSRPRLAGLFNDLGQRAIGLVCTLLALVLILPIPLGNMLPAAAVTVLSLSLVQRDGLLALAGYALAVASAGVLVVAAGIVMAAVQHFFTVITPA